MIERMPGTSKWRALTSGHTCVAEESHWRAYVLQFRKRKASRLRPPNHRLCDLADGTMTRDPRGAQTALHAPVVGVGPVASVGSLRSQGARDRREPAIAGAQCAGSRVTALTVYCLSDAETP